MANWRWVGNIELGPFSQIIGSDDGSPEGAVAGPKGSLWLQTDGVQGSCLWVKQTNSGTTGWVPAGSQLQKYTVSALPTGVEGAVAFATDGLKVGESTSAGTGVPVYYSNGAWRVYSTDDAVAS